MGKVESSRVFRWGGVSALGAWLAMCHASHVQAQPHAFDSLLVGSTWWCGDLGMGRHLF